jgi:hypothetical protein
MSALADTTVLQPALLKGPMTLPGDPSVPIAADDSNVLCETARGGSSNANLPLTGALVSSTPPTAPTDSVE